MTGEPAAPVRALMAMSSRGHPKASWSYLSLVLLAASGGPVCACGSSLRAETTPVQSEGYRFARPADWRMERFRGGFFLRSPEFGGAVIMAHVGAATSTSPADLEARLRKTLEELKNLRWMTVTEAGRRTIGGRDAVWLRYHGRALVGGEVAGVASGVNMPNGRVLVTILRALPPDRLADCEPVYDGLLESVEFEVVQP